MLTGNTQPLDIAKHILQPATIQAVSKAPYNKFGWDILDRWALNSPRALRQLEADGEVILLGRLLEQQSLEQGLLTEHMADLATGVAKHEVLQQHQVQTELE